MIAENPLDKRLMLSQHAKKRRSSISGSIDMQQKEGYNMSKFSEWTDGLAVGGYVTESSSFSPRIIKVERITKTLIVAGGRKYRRSDGGLVAGDRWSGITIRAITDTDRAKIRAVRIERKFHEVFDNIKSVEMMAKMLGQYELAM